MRVVILCSSLYDTQKKEGISLHAEYLIETISKKRPYDRQILLLHAKENDIYVSEETIKVRTTSYMTREIVKLTFMLLFRVGIISNVLRTTNNEIHLFGYHWIFIIPFLHRSNKILFIPFDCWSNRERSIAIKMWRATGGGILHSVARFLFSKILTVFEYLSFRRCNLIGVVSDIESEKVKEHVLWPIAHARTTIVPFPPLTPILSWSPKTELKPQKLRVAIWMDCRVAYGIESVRTALDGLDYLEESSGGARLSVCVLSRISESVFLNIFQGSHHFSLDNIEYVEDIDNCLSEFDIVILPDNTGSGIKNRLLRVISLGKILIATESALSGINREIRKFCYLANTPREIGDSISEIESKFSHALAKAGSAQEMASELLDSRAESQFLQALSEELG